MKISKKEAIALLSAGKLPFVNLFTHGTLSLEIYKPEGVDLQQPHTRDEVYIIVSGSGEFLNNGVKSTFSEGDFLFAPAGVAHKFENFTADFSTWVIFYGPEGGEKQNP